MTDVSVFGSSFSTQDRRLAQRAVPHISQQSSFSPRDRALIQARLPALTSQAAYRAGGVLPRAIHALNNRQDPSNQGMDASQAAYRRHVQGSIARLGGFGGFGGLGATSPGCTGTGGQVFQGLLAGTGGALLGSAQNMTTTTTLTSPSGAYTQTVPNTSATQTQQNLLIAGAIANIGSAIYTGVCEAKTGTTSPAVTRAADAGSAVGSLLGSIQTARSTATASAVTPSVAAATNPNSADAAATMATTQQAAGAGTPAKDNTILYVGIGVVAIIGIAVAMR